MNRGCRDCKHLHWKLDIHGQCGDAGSWHCMHKSCFKESPEMKDAFYGVHTKMERLIDYEEKNKDLNCPDYNERPIEEGHRTWWERLWGIHTSDLRETQND